MTLAIDKLQTLCSDSNIAITKHAKNRLVERGIMLDDIISGIASGEIIKQYEDDKPFPSCLILGKDTNRNSIHIVASSDNAYIYLITAYYPDCNEWEPDLKTRRRHE